MSSPEAGRDNKETECQSLGAQVWHFAESPEDWNITEYKKKKIHSTHVQPAEKTILGPKWTLWHSMEMKTSLFPKWTDSLQDI